MKCDAMSVMSVYDNIIMLCLLCNSVVQALTKRHQKSTAVKFKQFLQYEVLIFN